MKKDLSTVIKKIASFLNIKADENLIKLVAERSSFEYMKEHDDQFSTKNDIYEMRYVPRNYCSIGKNIN